MYSYQFSVWWINIFGVCRQEVENSHFILLMCINQFVILSTIDFAHFTHTHTRSLLSKLYNFAHKLNHLIFRSYYIFIFLFLVKYSETRVAVDIHVIYLYMQEQVGRRYQAVYLKCDTSLLWCNIHISTTELNFKSISSKSD